MATKFVNTAGRPDRVKLIDVAGVILSRGRPRGRGGGPADSALATGPERRLRAVRPWTPWGGPPLCTTETAR